MRFHCISLLLTGISVPTSSFSYLENMGSGDRPTASASAGPQRKNFLPFKTPTSGTSYADNFGNEQDGGHAGDAFISNAFNAPTGTAVATDPFAMAAVGASTGKKSNYMYSPKLSKPDQQQRPSARWIEMASCFGTPTAEDVSSVSTEPLGTVPDAQTPDGQVGVASASSYTNGVSPPSAAKKSSYMYSPNTSKPVQKSLSYVDNISDSAASFGTPEPASTSLPFPVGEPELPSGLSSGSYADHLSPPSAPKKSSYMYSPKTSNPVQQSPSYLDNVASGAAFGTPEIADSALEIPAGSASGSFADHLSPPSAPKKSSYMYSPKTAKPVQNSSSYLGNVSSAAAKDPPTSSASYMDALSPPSEAKPSSYMYAPQISKPAEAPNTPVATAPAAPAEPMLETQPEATEAEAPEFREPSPATEEVDRLVRKTTPTERMTRARFVGMKGKDPRRLMSSPPKNRKKGWFSMPPDPLL